jgi:hypothetical protein
MQKGSVRHARQQARVVAAAVNYLDKLGLLVFFVRFVRRRGEAEPVSYQVVHHRHAHLAPVAVLRSVHLRVKEREHRKESGVSEELAGQSEWTECEGEREEWRE